MICICTQAAEQRHFTVCELLAKRFPALRVVKDKRSCVPFDLCPEKDRVWEFLRPPQWPYLTYSLECLFVKDYEEHFQKLCLVNQCLMVEKRLKSLKLVFMVTQAFPHVVRVDSLLLNVTRPTKSLESVARFAACQFYTEWARFVWLAWAFRGQMVDALTTTFRDPKIFTCWWPCQKDSFLYSVPCAFLQ